MSLIQEKNDEKDDNDEFQETLSELETDQPEKEESIKPLQENRPEKFQPIKNLKFCGMRDPVHPKLFIENFEHFADQEKFDEVKKQNYFIESLSKYAAIWMEERGYGTYEEMKEAFLSFYWSSDVQNSFKKYLDFGKYNRKCRLSMANYFFKQAIGAKFLDTAPSEKEIIAKLLKHFDSNIEDEILIQKAQTIEEVVGILKRIDVLKGNKPISKPEKNFFMSVVSSDNKKNSLNSWGWLFFWLAFTSVALNLISKVYLTK